MSSTKTTLEDLRRAWDQLAPRYDQLLTPVATQNAELVLAHTRIGPGVRVLDIGCGTGALAVPAARRGAQVTAVDLSPRMIELLAHRARDASVPVTGTVMDAHDLDLPDACFDVVLSQNGVTMSPRLARTLAEMLRVARPGGQVLVAAFGPLAQVEFLSLFFAGVHAAVPGFTGLPTDPPPPPFQVADPGALEAALEAAGASAVAVHQVTWRVPVSSAQDLWREVTASNPLGAQAVAWLSTEQRDDALQVLERMLRERFDGQPSGTLHATVNVGVGTA